MRREDSFPDPDEQIQLNQEAGLFRICIVPGPRGPERFIFIHLLNASLTHLHLNTTFYLFMGYEVRDDL